IKVDSPLSSVGASALLLHTWYFYGRSTVVYEDTLSAAPVSITGQYKRITEITMNDTLHDGYSMGYAYVLSAANDTLYKGEITLNDTNTWSSFQINLLPTGAASAPVDHFFIAFANNSNNRNCTEQGICDLLWLDDIVVNFATTGVSSPATETMAASVYPNPAGNFLNILHHYPASTLLHYEIYDSQGRLCSSGAINKNQTTLTIGELSTGLYLLNLRTPAETTVLRFRRE
ncbi:MAG: T9SS type A sorting domain-containing protein, partial [Bacteroidia bacterium]